MTRETTSDWAPAESWRKASARSGASPATWACTSRRRRPEQGRRRNWASTQVDWHRRRELRRRPLRCRARKFVSWRSRKRRAESKKEMEAQMRGQKSHFMWRVCMERSNWLVRMNLKKNYESVFSVVLVLWLSFYPFLCNFSLLSHGGVCCYYVCYCLFNSSHVIQMWDANMSLNILIYQRQEQFFAIIQNLNSKYSDEWNCSNLICNFKFKF